MNSPIQRASDDSYQCIDINKNQLRDLQEIVILMNEIIKNSVLEGDHRQEKHRFIMESLHSSSNRIYRKNGIISKVRPLTDLLTM
jgi:hypothetical protein